MALVLPSILVLPTRVILDQLWSLTLSTERLMEDEAAKR